MGLEKALAKRKGFRMCALKIGAAPVAGQTLLLKKTLRA